MQPMTYREAWAFLDNLQFFKIKLGLESMNRFLASVGNPHLHLPCIHVAGTNGKGSVSTTLLTLLHRAGYKVGLYTSPHLCSVRERFRLGDRYISEEEFAEHASAIRGVLGENQITYFEFTTALALLWFAQERVDVAILEVGMGGRLDATNVVVPLVSVITNVTMDHEQYLGDTLAAVAGEKAGIIKPGVPVVSGVGPDDSREVVEQVAHERGAPFFLLGRDFRAERLGEGGWRYHGEGGRVVEGLRCLLKGEYQIDNAALALAVLDRIAGILPVADAVIREGLLSVRWPGRLEYFCIADGQPAPCPEEESNGNNSGLRRFLLDGAHNPAGVESLAAALRHEFCYDRLILVWACMADKDMAGTLHVVSPMADHIVFTRPESERSATPAQLAALLPAADQPKATSAATVAEALAMATVMATPGDLICVAGSLYLVGAARGLLLGGLVE